MGAEKVKQHANGPAPIGINNYLKHQTEGPLTTMREGARIYKNKARKS